jgi:hypothetical protein
MTPGSNPTTPTAGPLADNDKTKPWNLLAVDFFKLASYEEEAELFATMGRLEKDDKWLARNRDKIFTSNFVRRFKRQPKSNCWTTRLDLGMGTSTNISTFNEKPRTILKNGSSAQDE